MTTDIIITKTSDGTFRIDTANGVSSTRNPAEAATIATDLLGSLPADQAATINGCLCALLDAMGCNLISIDPCEVAGRRAFDFHASRHGVLADMFTVDACGDVAAF